jgi:hypothetical protein
MVDSPSFIIFTGEQRPYAHFDFPRSSLPESVEVAAGIHSLYLISLAERKADFRLLAGVQFLALIALFCLKGDPLDAVLLLHGVLRRADLDMDNVSLHRICGNVLLQRGVNGAGNELRHLLAAADDGHAAVPDLGDGIAARPAEIKFLLHGARSFPLFQ